MQFNKTVYTFLVDDKIDGIVQHFVEEKNQQHFSLALDKWLQMS